MKRKDIMKRLKEAGCTFSEGGEHTLVYKNGRMITQVPRHKEVSEILAKIILRKADA